MPPEYYQMLRNMANTMGGQQVQPQAPDFGALLAQLRNDPQGDANKAYIPGVMNQANPFANGFFGPGLTPEAKLASQGPSAMNQWGQLGQVQGVDALNLGALMDARQAASAPLAQVGNASPQGQAVPGYQQQTPMGTSKLPNAQGGFDLVGQPQYGNPSMLQGTSQMVEPSAQSKPTPFGTPKRKPFSFGSLIR